MGREGAVRRGLCHTKQTVPRTPPTPTSFHRNPSKIKRRRSDEDDTHALVIAHPGPAIALSQFHSWHRGLPGLRPCMPQCQRPACPSRTPIPESGGTCTAPAFCSLHPRAPPEHPGLGFAPVPGQRGSSRRKTQTPYVCTCSSAHQHRLSLQRPSPHFSPQRQICTWKQINSTERLLEEMVRRLSKGTQLERAKQQRGDAQQSWIPTKARPQACGARGTGQLTLRSHTFSQPTDELLGQQAACTYASKHLAHSVSHSRARPLISGCRFPRAQRALYGRVGLFHC